MVIFLLIALSYMMRVEAEQVRIKHVAVVYTEIEDALYDERHKEFRVDLPKWQAELQAIRVDFFPRYVRIDAETCLTRILEVLR
jgi:hypothetical protein